MLAPADDQEDFSKAVDCLRRFGNNAFDVEIVERAEEGDPQALKGICTQLFKPERLYTEEVYKYFSRPLFRILSREERKISMFGDSADSSSEAGDECQGPDFCDLLCDMESSAKGATADHSEDHVEPQPVLEKERAGEETFEALTPVLMPPPPFSSTDEMLMKHALGGKGSRECVLDWISTPERRKQIINCYTVEFGGKHERMHSFTFSYRPDVALGIEASAVRPVLKEMVNEIFSWSGKPQPYAARKAISNRKQRSRAARRNHGCHLLGLKAQKWVVERREDSPPWSWKRILDTGRARGIIRKSIEWETEDALRCWMFNFCHGSLRDRLEATKGRRGE